MKPRAIPDRWESYNPIGRKVEGTRFIPFKVPLKESVSVKVESAKRLDDQILLRRIPNLGLIIDLTNTYRYYDPSVFAKEGIQYEKIMIPGKETPAKKLTSQFLEIVQNFLNSNKNNDKLIGVHCTHGVNRTGYLICYYMISQMTMEPKEAMDKFTIARGYQIERINYINDLQNLKSVIEQDYREKSSRRERQKKIKKSCNIDVNRSCDNTRAGSSKYENWRDRSTHSSERNHGSERQAEHKKDCNRNVNRSSDRSRAGSSKYENWREHSPHLRERTRQRTKPEEYQKNYKGAVNRSSDNSCGRSSTYENWSARCAHSDNSHRSYKREDNFPDSCRSNQAGERSIKNYAHTGRNIDHHCTMSSRHRGLSLDYYNTRPTT